MTSLTTEGRNPKSAEIDTLSSTAIVELMNAEDAGICAAIATQKEAIAAAIDVIAKQFAVGGRLFYLGAGTSGRLGVLDASECPPTFNTPPEMVVGVIAGGAGALTRAIEGAEDDAQQSTVDLAGHDFGPNDVLVGIATSGRTPYVIGGLQYAAHLGAATVAFTCNGQSKLHDQADIVIAPVVGAEVVSGSTRLKAGTATKMVLNMLTTGAMIRIGKTYGNLMVDLRASNEKLRLRSVGIMIEFTGLDAATAQQRLAEADGQLKTAIVAFLCDVSPATARDRLAISDGRLRDALNQHMPKPDTVTDSANDGQSHGQ